VSTCCVAGRRTGSIPETLSETPPEFVNAYERSKWRAERLAAEAGAGLPTVTVRLSTVIGGRADGRLARPGAFHHALQWMARGLVPMVPAAPGATVDLIDAETAAELIADAALADDPPPVVQVAAGARAAPVGELLDLIAEEFDRLTPGRRTLRPVETDAETFALFRRSVLRTGDALLAEVLAAGEAFLPGLLHPKVFETSRAERLRGGPLPTAYWRGLVARVIGYCVRTDWGRRTPEGDIP
jgi:nucleoside-diphosphate-sugar epimerase